MIQDHKKNLRRDVSTLKGAQRKRFFWCLKMLGILPPPKAFQKWTYMDIVNVEQQPVCLHDVLIASHASTSEHHCFYFPSYHRNQLLLLQVFLNYADQVLTNRAIPKKYQSKALEPLWEQVFKEYGEIKTTQKGKVLIHYWNPTNFANSQSILYPPELTERNEGKSDSIDILFKNIRNSWPWSINPLERLYNNNNLLCKGKKFKEQFKQKVKDPARRYILFEQDTNGSLQNYLNSQRYKDLVVKGSTNLRSDPQTASSSFAQFYNTSDKLIGYRNNKEYINGERQDLKTQNLTNDEVLVNYFSKEKNMHYVSKKQQQKYQDDTLSKIKALNNLNPQFTLTDAIYGDVGKKFQDFAKNQNAISKPHDTLHVLSGIFMNHGSFSPTSFIFFLYHSWIDATIEIRIRTDYKYVGEIENFMHHPLACAGQTAFVPFLNSTNGKTIIQELKKLRTNDRLTEQLVGFHPVMSWSKRDTLQFKAYFGAYEYYLRNNGKELRKSYQMGEIYKKRFYEVVKNDFPEYKCFSDFDYDYNYEYLSGLNDKTYLDAEQKGHNIPLYLQVIAADLHQGTNINILDSAKAITNSQIQPPQVKNQTEQEVQVNNLQPVISRKKDAIQTIANQYNQYENSLPTVYYEKLLRKSLAVLVKHQSTIDSGIHQIGIKLKNSQDIKQQISESHLKYFEKVEKEGIILDSYPIFSKGKAAEHCIKCKQFKYDILELGSKLFSSFPQLWKQVGKYILSKNRVVATTKVELSVNCYTQRLQAFATGPLQVKLITGAEQVYFETVYNGYKKGTIRVEADSKSILKDQIVTTASHINYSLSKGFDFYKLWDSSLQDKNIDSFVYKNIRVIANIGGKVKAVRFSIPSYHKLIRYTLAIEDTEDDYEIEIADADYEFKQTFLKRYCPRSM